MADEINIRVTVDDQDVVNSLERQSAKARELQNTFSSVGAASEESIKELTKAIKVLSTEIDIAQLRQKSLAERANESAKAAQKGGTSFKAFAKFAGKLGLATAAATAAAKLLVDIFKKTGDVVDFVSDKIAFLSGAYTELTSRIGRFFNDLFNGISITEAYTTATEGATKAIIEAGRAAEFSNQAQRVLNNAIDTNTIIEASRIKQAQEARQVVEDTNRTFGERIAALRQAGKLEEMVAERRLELAQQQLKIDQDNELSQTEEAKRIAEISALEAALSATRFNNEQQLRGLREERNEAYRREQELFADLADRADKFRQSLTAMQDGARTGLGAIQAEGIAALEELDRLSNELRALYAERGVQFDLEEDIAQARAFIEQETSRKIIQYRRQETQARREEAQAAADAEREAAFARLDLQEEISLNAADLIERVGLTEAEAIRAAELEKLNIQRRFAQERLALIAEQFGPTSPQATLIRQEIEFIRQEYQALANTPLLGNAFRDKLIAFLGLNEESLSYIEQQASGLADNLVGAITAATESQIEQQDNLLRAINDRISETESLYEEELRRQELGLANNAELVKESLEQQNQEREKAEAKRLQLEKRAANQRLAIDAAQQTSAYLTTILRLGAAEAFKGVAGLVTLAAGIAILARIVAQARANSRQFRPQAFRDGTEYVNGPGTRRSDSIPARLSVGERVLPADLNEAIGGRAVSNEELVRMFKVGRAFTLSDTFAPTDAALAGILTSYHAGAEQREMAIARMQMEAYRSAAMEAAQQTIQYWKTRPVDKIGPDGPYTEWAEGNTIKRVRKSTPDV